MSQISNASKCCNGIQTKKETIENVCLMFTPKCSDEVGSLERYLKIFSQNSVNLKYIESRPSSSQEFEFIVECVPSGNLNHAISILKSETSFFKTLSGNHNNIIDDIPPFPRCISDLDRIRKEILSYGAELNADHPGFTDEIYRKRRKYFTNIVYSYQPGQPLARVEYTQEEISTWGAVFRKLTELYPTHACKEFNKMFSLLINNCGFREDNIPQLEDVSNFLKGRTGFQLRPAAGLLSLRDFLAGLAFRVFHTTQYIRHSSQPLYTPEPDICHELLGHAALFADPDYAQLVQDIGLASLGAPDEYVEKLGTCFWFTVEFGLCIENGNLKAFGGGLLSSYGELQYAIEGRAKIKPFEPAKAALETYPITTYQPLYFVAESLKDVRERMIKFSKSIPKKFQLRYNSYTQSVEILNSKSQILSLLENVNQETEILLHALKKL